MNQMNRQHILDEIKRTAEENGGIPLGVRRFRTETGIREYAWQKYWARFADAQREAGFDPNEKSVGYSDELLIEKFVAPIHEIKRFPTRGDIRVKEYSDVEFPSEKVYRRFGTKFQFAAKMAQYCSGRTGYDDVAALCASIIPNKRASHADVPEITQFGFVYLIKGGASLQDWQD
jgi:hypothetical protein